jgi:hypothetical protein
LTGIDPWHTIPRLKNVLDVENQSLNESIKADIHDLLPDLTWKGRDTSLKI